MKRFTLLCLVLFCLVGTYNTGVAQDNVTTKLCDKGGTETMSSRVCYPKSEYSEEVAIDSFKVYMLSGYACSVEECPRPRRSECSPFIVEIPETDETETHWCFKGKVKWKCSPCGPKTPKPVVTDGEAEEVEIEGTLTGGEGSARNYDHEEVSIPHNPITASIGKIKKVYPNPTSGNVNLRLELGKEHTNALQLIVTNVQGKQLISKSYENIPASIFHARVDASELPAGVYFLNAQVDGITVGSSRLIIQ